MEMRWDRPGVLGAGRWAMRANALVCLVLLSLLALVSVAHIHPATGTAAGTAANTDLCPVCVMMHSAAPVNAAAPATVKVVESAAVVTPVTHTVVRRWQYSMFNRPPPNQV